MSKFEKLSSFLEQLFGDEQNQTKIVIKEFTTEGANYSSIIFKILVLKKDNIPLHLFAKVASITEEVRKEMNADKAYDLERYFYTTITPVYEQLQYKHISNAKDRFRIPKFYGCKTDLNEETIILEDLTAQGYFLYDRFKPLSLNYATKAIQEIAKFHALSFAFKDEYPNLFAENENIFDWSTTFYKAMRNIFRNTANKVYDIVPENLRHRYIQFIDNVLTDEGIEKCLSSGKFSVIVHGDYRASNIMHKSLQNGEVSSLIPVDYQTLNIGSPTSDIIYLLYLGTDEEFRRNHLKYILEIYYNTLSSWLNQMNLNPDKVFSKEDFYEEYKSTLNFGLFVATFLLPIVLVDVKDTPKFGQSTSDLNNFSVKISNLFKERYIPILYEFAEIGLL